jgi:hypothetical protein
MNGWGAMWRGHGLELAMFQKTRSVSLFCADAYQYTA